MFIILQNNDILLQALFFKIYDSRDNTRTVSILLPCSSQSFLWAAISIRQFSFAASRCQNISFQLKILLFVFVGKLSPPEIKSSCLRQS